VRNLQPGESFDPNQSFAVGSPIPYAAEIKRGEDLENREAREAEGKGLEDLREARFAGGCNGQ
jgi:hypothetical protein